MGKHSKLKKLRKEIRDRFQSRERNAVAQEMLNAKNGSREVKRLYFTALDPLLFDQANKL